MSIAGRTTQGANQAEFGLPGNTKKMKVEVTIENSALATTGCFADQARRSLPEWIRMGMVPISPSTQHAKCRADPPRSRRQGAGFLATMGLA